MYRGPRNPLDAVLMSRASCRETNREPLLLPRGQSSRAHRCEGTARLVSQADPTDDPCVIEPHRCGPSRRGRHRRRDDRRGATVLCVKSLVVIESAQVGHDTASRSYRLVSARSSSRRVRLVAGLPRRVSATRSTGAALSWCDDVDRAAGMSRPHNRRTVPRRPAARSPHCVLAATRAVLAPR